MSVQLSALMAAGEIKLQEHEEMAQEIARLREAISHAEGEKGPVGSTLSLSPSRL